MTVITKSPEQTELLGKKLPAFLRPGDVIAYYGDLGAGKTAFTRGLAAGLGIREAVMMLICGTFLDTPSIVLYAVMMRLASTCADVVAFGIGAGYQRIQQKKAR